MCVAGVVVCVILGTLATGSPEGSGSIRVTVPFVEYNEVDLAELVVRLSDASGLEIARPRSDVTLPATGLAGKLTRKLLAASLGSEVEISVEGHALVLSIDSKMLTAARKTDWERRVRDLAREADREAKRRTHYGMHALKSYRANDPSRPTVCLIHGVNSSSGGFVHTIPPIEEAGYGVVVFDYRFNRSLEETCETFSRDWREFRRRAGETRPWAIVTHSMGALVARDYVEGVSYQGDASSLVMIAPVNQGSHLAQTQTLLQFINGTRAVNGRKTSDALAHLGDGLGEAAADMTPGSVFLKTLNARPRRAGLPYHIVAGDVGVLTMPARRQIDGRFEAARAQGGLFGGLARLAAGADLTDRLDELTDGRGDGCVSIARTRLDGVTDHVVIHANHAELIRAPLLFAEPGPVACMPEVLRWLGQTENAVRRRDRGN